MLPLQILEDMMTSFNVLDRSEMIHRNLLLEASAGTGKTFAIENIVVRLLIEPSDDREPLLIENILVVTFTRMAARELKERIHSNLERSLTLFKRYLSGNKDGDQFPDYLLVPIEKGEQAVLLAIKSIERALFSFDHSQIFTIHGFCWRMLKSYAIEAGISLDSSSQEDRSLSSAQLMQVVRDFLRRGLLPSIYSPQQLKIIMKRANRKSEKLQKDLLSQVNRGVSIVSPPSFTEFLLDFQKKMALLKNECGLCRHKIIEDFLTLAPFYKELRNINKQIHPEKMLKVERFATLFDKELWQAEDLDVLIEDGIFLLEIFDPSLLMAKAKPLASSVLHYPSLLKDLAEYLSPVVDEARSEASLFARLASDCQKFVQCYQEQEEMFGHSELLVQMRKAVNKPEFLKCVRSLYSTAIVDEFQDTDPIQWEIFCRLFITQQNEWKGHLNLVGDPKQSIYAFRQADIYTYLSAAEKLGQKAFSTLDTNFRSRSSLVDALNLLFEASQETFSLPKIMQSLPYRKVKVGRKDTYNNQETSLHFWQVFHRSKLRNPLHEIEIDYLFPAIAKEILKLNEQGVRFGQFAILIADRYQASRVCEYLKTLDIPVISQKSKDLSNSLVVDVMKDLLNGIVNCHSRSDLKIALATRIVGITHQELLNFEHEDRIFPFLEKFDRLKKIFHEDGFSKFYSQFMMTSWHADGRTVLERILNQSGGDEFYREWQDLADVMIAEEYTQSLLPHDVINFLENLEELSQNEDERIKAYIDPDEEGVSILTTHVSKGLEFDYVFALGLIKRSKQSENALIPLEDKNRHMLVAVKNEHDPRYLKYCEESDAEKMRQLYVGLTRAKEKLYIPVVVDEFSRTVPLGCASPMELFLARLDKPVTDYKGLYQRISLEDGSALRNFVDKCSSKMTLSILEKDVEEILRSKQEKSFTLIPPRSVLVPGSYKALQSFTSLAQMKNIEHRALEKDLFVPHDFSLEEKTVHTLPSGNETGVMLHEIFEKIPFNIAKNLRSYQALKPLISPFLQGTSFASWEDVITKMVFNTLKTPLGKQDFCLADISPSKMYRETEFLYCCDNESFKTTAIKSGFLKGVADVFFEHQGKFYLVDWKSNWLGPSDEYYRVNHLEEAMRINQYDLQAVIYCEAFHRYLKIFDKNSSKDVFGGIYYFFVRGIGPETGRLLLTL